jgi:hypothetical protein
MTVPCIIAITIGHITQKLKHTQMILIMIFSIFPFILYSKTSAKFYRINTTTHNSDYIITSIILHTAIKLSLFNSSYFNYENEYSEPPAGIIVKFCDVLNITMKDLLELKVAAPQHTTIRTFADLLSILIDLDRRGLSIKGNTTYSQQDNQLSAHLSLDIKNAQIATFIPDWNKVNEELVSSLMDEDEYQAWSEDTLKLFNVPIDN